MGPCRVFGACSRSRGLFVSVSLWSFGKVYEDELRMALGQIMHFANLDDRFLRLGHTGALDVLAFGFSVRSKIERNWFIALSEGFHEV